MSFTEISTDLLYQDDMASLELTSLDLDVSIRVNVTCVSTPCRYLASDDLVYSKVRTCVLCLELHSQVSLPVLILLHLVPVRPHAVRLVTPLANSSSDCCHHQAL